MKHNLPIYISKVLSSIFSPLLIPTYVTYIALFNTYMKVTEPRIRLLVVLSVFVFTCIVPLLTIATLKALKKANSFDLIERKERPIPYSVAIVCYIGLFIYLGKIHAPEWLSVFFLSAAIAGIINAIITIWWKISGHATAMGALVAFTFLIDFSHLTFSGSNTIFLCSVVVAGAVCSSRLILQRHTPMQLAAGFLCGVSTVTISELLI